jgi:hypothetical protein
MLTSAQDDQLAVWDLATPEATLLAKHALPAAAVAAAWHPAANEVTAALADGSLLTWQNPVPAHLPGPDAAPAALSSVLPGACLSTRCCSPCHTNLCVVR